MIAVNHRPNQPSLRSDFQKALQGRMVQIMGAPGTAARAQMEQMFGDALGSDGYLELNKLPARTQHELKKLQTAAEGFETHFVKDLMSKMRQSTMSKEKSQMADMANDMMDQAIGEATAQGASSIGIAKTIFVNMGEQLVRAGATDRTISGQKQAIK